MTGRTGAVERLRDVMWVDARPGPRRRAFIRLYVATFIWAAMLATVIVFWVLVARGVIPWHLATENQHKYLRRDAPGILHMLAGVAFAVAAVLWPRLLAARWALLLRWRGLLRAAGAGGAIRLTVPGFFRGPSLVITDGSKVVVRTSLGYSRESMFRSDGPQTIIFETDNHTLETFSQVRTGLFEVDSLVALLESRGCTVDVWPEFGFGGTQEAESGPADAR